MAGSVFDADYGDSSVTSDNGRKRFIVMGAGEVGYHLALTLSEAGHDLVVIENHPERCARVEEELDVSVVHGSGTHVAVLDAAGVATCDLFMAVSSVDEANLTASLLAKHMGARRSVVRVAIADEVIIHRRLYEDLFDADLLLSTQLLTTTRILNQIRGHNTVAVEYFANGKVQLRKIHLDQDSLLTQRPLRDIQLPSGSLVVAYYHDDELIIPSGDDRARSGDDALILGKTEVISRFERMVTRRPEVIGTVVVGGGSQTGFTIAQALQGFDAQVKIIEKNRRRAEELSAHFPQYQILQGDLTDLSLLRAERVAQAQCFIAVSGHDDTNLMASLLVQELGVPKVVTLVNREETTQLWRRLGLTQVLCPRALAYERIREYVENGYRSNIVSLRGGAALVVERHLAEASPAAGVTLEQISPPRGLIVGTVVRGDRVFVPRGSDRLEAGDDVILFVREEELDTVRLLFPGPAVEPVP